jgi:ATP-dependent helicase HrpA
VADAAFRLLATIAGAHHALGARLAQTPPGSARLAAELRAQRDELVRPGFFASTPWAQLQHLPRYLEAWTRRWRERRDRDRAAGRQDPALDEFRWLLEELRVSLFAQELKTPAPVSLKRVEKAWEALEGR